MTNPSGLSSVSRKKIRLTLAALLLASVAQLQPQLYAQGCVAARGSGMSCMHLDATHGDMAIDATSGFNASVGYRWLHSDRHFTGDEEDHEREEEGSQVINDSNFIDLNLTYAFSPRYSVTATLPFVVNDRSQVVRDQNRVILRRFHTQSAGIGDARLVAHGWVLDPKEPRQGNVLLGLGVDMPTGEKDARDTFQVFNRTTGTIEAQERTVDQSIQPGDGGWGIILDLYAYREIIPRLNAFVEGSYTITPEEKNGVPTFRSNPYEAEMSITDSYLGRGGLEYVLWPKHGLTLSLAGRIEGVPVTDLVGGSNGFRRPGYAISIEPGIAMSVQSWTFALSTPVAVYRNRERSVADKQASSPGDERHGDAAFADYLVMFTVGKKF